ncbi:hypothetical protein [Halalkalibacter urbisdiaboli]|uniref:hypothetical protein n=1 Tax=Halalkalibacter urbisdiaboli TaxID=1960589 RepID=UPI000B436AE4|nr:hypothetical protein [Halalkalibacter urbisdiaboli]
MKKGLAVIGIIFIVSLIGYGGYQLLLGYASEKMMNHVSDEFLTEESVDQYLEDPFIKDMLEDLKKNDHSQQEHLPFTTKEEGLKVVMSKFSAKELTDIARKVQSGLTPHEQQEFIQKYQDRLTEEELQALIVIGLKEYNQ